MAGEFSSIPILDFSQTVSPATRPLFLSELRNALTQVGCFYLKNHSVPEQTLQGAVQQSNLFFNLPLEKKLELEIQNSRHFLGYSRVGSEKTAGMLDHNESFTIGPELPAPSQDEPIYHNLRGPNMVWLASIILFAHPGSPY